MRVASDGDASLLALTRARLEAALGDGLEAVAARARLESLEHVAMLRALTREQREILVGLLRPRPLEKGETVFREGDVGDEMFLVESGEVVIARRRGHRGEGEERLKTVTRGEYFGELALLRGDPRAASATVQSEGGAFLLTLSRDDLTSKFGPLRDALDAAATRAYTAGTTPRVGFEPATRARRAGAGAHAPRATHLRVSGARGARRGRVRKGSPRAAETTASSPSSVSARRRFSPRDCSGTCFRSET